MKRTSRVRERMRWVVPILSACAIFALVGWSSGAEATTVLRLNLDALLGESSVVLEGTVVSVANDEGDLDHVPTTIYEICSLEVIVGEHDQDCRSLRVPGGWRGEMHSGYSGMPQLTEDERYLFFFTKDTDWNSPFTGWWQGVYHIVDGGNGPAVLSNVGFPVTGLDANGFIKTRRDVRFIQTPLGEAEHASRTTRANPVDKQTAARSAMSRSEFTGLIRATAQAREVWGLRVPQRLPTRWTCRDLSKRAVASPPPLVSFEEVLR